MSIRVRIRHSCKHDRLNEQEQHHVIDIVHNYQLLCIDCSFVHNAIHHIQVCIHNSKYIYTGWPKSPVPKLGYKFRFWNGTFGPPPYVIIKHTFKYLYSLSCIPVVVHVAPFAHGSKSHGLISSVQNGSCLPGSHSHL